MGRRCAQLLRFRGVRQNHRLPFSSDPEQPPYHEKAIDGMLNYIGGANGIYMNYRFAEPTRTQRQHIARWFPEFQFPFADLTIFDPVTKKIDGRLARCEETNTCPKIFEANSENEFWAKGGRCCWRMHRGTTAI